MQSHYVEITFIPYKLHTAISELRSTNKDEMMENPWCSVVSLSLVYYSSRMLALKGRRVHSTLAGVIDRGHNVNIWSCLLIPTDSNSEGYSKTNCSEQFVLELDIRHDFENVVFHS